MRRIKLSVFEIPVEHQILVRRPDLMIISKNIYHIMNFDEQEN